MFSPIVSWVSRWFILSLLLLIYPAIASADAKSDYLIRLLVESSQFRVRAQAAISLGKARDNPKAIAALISALKDNHPAVRAASASSLERLEDPTTLSALEAIKTDPEPAVKMAVQRAIAKLKRVALKQSESAGLDQTVTRVPVGPLKYYVGVGVPATKTNISKGLLLRAQRFIQEQISNLDGVLVAETNENPKRAKAVLRRKKLTGFYLDSSVVQLDKQPNGGTRAVVSIIVGTYPGRDMRSIIQGAATVMASGGSDTDFQAIQGAFRGALRRLPQALDRAVQ